MNFKLNTLEGSKRLQKWLRQGITLGVLLTAIVATTGYAYTTPSTAAKEEQDLRARQEEQQRQQQQQQKDVFLQKGKAANEDTSLPEEGTAFTVKTLILEGDNVKHFPWAQRMLGKYAGRKIGMEGINLIVKRLTTAFINRGYVTTRIVIPEQDLSTGTLRLVLIPGRVGSIRLDAKSARQNWQNAFPVKPGDILNLRRLEQGLEQMKRVSSQDVDMQLVPGKNQGETDVVLMVKETTPYKFVLSVDDAGTNETGKLQISEALSVDNLFGANDLFNYNKNGDGDRAGTIHGTRGDSVYYSIPFQDSTFSFTSSHYNYHQTVATVNQSFISSGENDSMEFHLTELLDRDQTSKTNLECAIIKGHIRSYIADTEIEAQRQDTTAFKLGLSRRQYFGQATLDLEVDNKRGVPWFGADSDSLATTGEDNRYNMWLIDTNLTAPVTLGGIKGCYRFTFHGQYTTDTLYQTDMISIGNRYTVRGFDGEETLSSESGWYAQNELALSFPDGFQVYTGLDYGEVYGEYTHNLLGRILAGAVVGIRGGSKAVGYDLFVGWPLREPAGFVTGNPTYGFQCTYQI